MTTMLCVIWIVLFAIFGQNKPNGIAPYLIGGALTFIIGLSLLVQMDMIFVNPNYHIEDDDFCRNDNCKRMIYDYVNRHK